MIAVVVAAIVIIVLLQQFGGGYGAGGSAKPSPTPETEKIDNSSAKSASPTVAPANNVSANNALDGNPVVQLIQKTAAARDSVAQAREALRSRNADAIERALTSLKNHRDGIDANLQKEMDGLAAELEAIIKK